MIGSGNEAIQSNGEDPSLAASAPTTDMVDSPERPRTNAALREEAIRRMTLTAIRLIAEQGAARLSLVDVGREAGFSHSLPNYYFGSKKGLLLHVYSFLVKGAPGKIGRWWRARQLGHIRPGLPHIRATIRGYLGLVEDDPAPSRAWHVLWSESISSMPELLESVRAMNRRFVDFFAQELKVAIERGEADPDIDVEALAMLLAAAVRGVVAQYMVDPERVDPQRIADTLIMLLDRGIGMKTNIT